jgi:flagellar motor switch/type III secretory pathway protein FliN
MAETQTVQNDAAQVQAPDAEVRNVEFESVAQTAPTGQENLDLLLEISMPITVNLGKARIPL